MVAFDKLWYHITVIMPDETMVICIDLISLLKTKLAIDVYEKTSARYFVNSVYPTKFYVISDLSFTDYLL